tara:strand:- start:1925 stop:2845 length:921 start_codon:yes stop_codon:yes gene_type:complete
MTIQTQPTTDNVSATLTDSAPSISSSAMLVELSISTWTGRKLDKQASRQVTTDNNAKTGIANVHKKLLGDCEELDVIQKFVGNVRNIHYSMTMPWSDTGMRLLPTAQYFNYHKTMTDFTNSHKELVTKFLNSYATSVADAQDKLGDLFKRIDYPSVDSIASKFRFGISYIPLPDVGDFRVDIGNEQKEVLQKSYTDYYANQLQNAMNDVWTRLHKVLKNMSERLDFADSDTKKIFRDTLVSNVIDIVELLSVCNVTKDSRMESMRLKLDSALRGVTADALRDDEFLRAETKQAVDEAIKSLPSLDL